MLILTRRPGESGNIGDDVRFTVLEVRGRTVRIGFDAPMSVKIDREEVYNHIKEIVEGVP